MRDHGVCVCVLLASPFVVPLWCLIYRSMVINNLLWAGETVCDWSSIGSIHADWRVVPYPSPLTLLWDYWRHRTFSNCSCPIAHGSGKFLKLRGWQWLWSGDDAYHIRSGHSTLILLCLWIHMALCLQVVQYSAVQYMFSYLFHMPVSVYVYISFYLPFAIKLYH